MFIFFQNPLSVAVLCSQPEFSGHHAIPRGFNCLRFDFLHNLQKYLYKQYE